MLLEVLRGIFAMANSFIALFIVIYAFLFLKHTKSHKERRPWDYLVVASIIYLAYTLVAMLLSIYGVQSMLTMRLGELSMFFQFVYTGLILLAFICQTDLIFKNEIIIITRKIGSKDKEIDIKITEKGEKVSKKNKEKVYIS